MADHENYLFSYRVQTDTLDRDKRYQTLPQPPSEPAGCMPAIRRKLYLLFSRRQNVAYNISHVEQEELNRIKRSGNRPLPERPESSQEPITLNYRRNSGPMSNRPRMALSEVVESDLQHPEEWLGQHGPPINRQSKPGLTTCKYIKGMFGQRWFWGPLAQKDASRVLEGRPNGSFLVRDSADDNHLYTITFRRDDTSYNIRINGISCKFSINPRRDREYWFDDPVQLINNYVSACEAGRPIRLQRQNSDVPLNLFYPVARFADQVHSLKDLSRFVLRLSLRKDQLNLLPIPTHLKPWIMEDAFWPRPDILQRNSDAEIDDDDKENGERPPVPNRRVERQPSRVNPDAAANHAADLPEDMAPTHPNNVAPHQGAGNYFQPMGLGLNQQG